MGRTMDETRWSGSGSTGCTLKLHSVWTLCPDEVGRPRWPSEILWMPVWSVALESLWIRTFPIARMPTFTRAERHSLRSLPRGGERRLLFGISTICFERLRHGSLMLCTGLMCLLGRRSVNQLMILTDSRSANTPGNTPGNTRSRLKDRKSVV